MSTEKIYVVRREQSDYYSHQSDMLKAFKDPGEARCFHCNTAYYG